MKLRIEVDEKIQEDEIVIKCKEIDSNIENIKKVFREMISKQKDIIFYKDEKEFYLSLDDVLFFETEGNRVSAHTHTECYRVKYKLYELEEILPKNFCRISKSTILNVNHIYSISKNITGVSLVEFQETYKKVYVSRYYYKILKNILGKR